MLIVNLRPVELIYRCMETIIQLTHRAAGAVRIPRLEPPRLAVWQMC
jgi:hypothetical protein